LQEVAHVNASYRITLVLLAVVMILSLLLNAGCLVSSSSNSRISGNYVPQDTFDRIEPGKTTAAWVKATLGEPSSKDAADDTEVWKYDYSEERDSSGAIFLLFAGSDKKEHKHVAYVEIKDGIVTQKWRA
jgi:outer membrane protein assembly factor BamE (lipoprotein component of BamABCDE complex)